jgi:hypothetical protein
MPLDIPLFTNTALWILLLVPLIIWAWFIAAPGGHPNGADEDEFSSDLANQCRLRRK